MQFTKEQRIQVHGKFGGKCAYCGNDIELRRMQIDHVIPVWNFMVHIKNNWKVPDFLKHLTENDVNHIDNLFPSCPVCNGWKKTFYLELFRHEIEEQIKRLNEYSANFRIAKRYGLVQETPKKVVFYFETLQNHG